MVSDRTAGAILELQRATHATLHALSRDLAGLRISNSEANALAVLADGRPRTVGELADLTGTRPTTLTSVLDRLEGRGYAAREVDPEDRRSFAVRLTADGRKAAVLAAAAVRHLEETALAGISDRQLAGFRAVLHALTENSR
ncbi:MAG TPA: MarR family transcriptional regulator [Streptosporangiaceae bacterium]|nr:MarR family transcriptional regulator [Streptosporangiaceae bacterium]